MAQGGTEVEMWPRWVLLFDSPKLEMMRGICSEPLATHGLFVHSFAEISGPRRPSGAVPWSDPAGRYRYVAQGSLPPST